MVKLPESMRSMFKGAKKITLKQLDQLTPELKRDILDRIPGKPGAAANNSVLIAKSGLLGTIGAAIATRTAQIGQYYKNLESYNDAIAEYLTEGE